LGTLRDGVDRSAIVPVSFPTLFEEKVLRDQYSTARPGTKHQRKCIKDPVHCYSVKISLTHDTTEEAIKHNLGLPATTHPTDQLEFFQPSNIGSSLCVAFDRSKKAKCHDESITLHREVQKFSNWLVHS
jgi:hypothetical protein